MGGRIVGVSETILSGRLIGPVHTNTIAAPFGVGEKPHGGVAQVKGETQLTKMKRWKMFNWFAVTAPGPPVG
jgi:hypothetical protein